MSDLQAVSSLTVDALSQSAIWLVAVVGTGLALAKPIMDFIHRHKLGEGEEKVYVAKNSAEAFLYNHLSEQIKEHSARASEAGKSNIELSGRVAHLEAQLSLVSEQSEQIAVLASRLSQKDLEFAEQLKQAAEERKEFMVVLKYKDQEIINRDLRIAALDRRQFELELRLTRDEESLAGMTPGFFCPECGHCKELVDAELSEQVIVQED